MKKLTNKLTLVGFTLLITLFSGQVAGAMPNSYGTQKNIIATYFPNVTPTVVPNFTAFATTVKGVYPLLSGLSTAIQTSIIQQIYGGFFSTATQNIIFGYFGTGLTSLTLPQYNILAGFSTFAYQQDIKNVYYFQTATGVTFKNPIVNQTWNIIPANSTN